MFFFFQGGGDRGGFRGTSRGGVGGRGGGGRGGGMIIVNLQNCFCNLKISKKF